MASSKGGRAVSRKGAAKKPAVKKPAKVAPARAKAPSKYQSALANPQMSSATRSVPIKPAYTKAWKAEVNRKNKAYDKSWWKKAGSVVENYTAFGAGDAVYRAVKGRDAKTGKKYNRATAAADAAFMLGSFGGGKVVKAAKAAKAGRNIAMQVQKDMSLGRHIALDLPVGAVRSSAKKQAKALATRKTKVATARQAAKTAAVTKKRVIKKVNKVK
jgi:hypothetical protein